MAEREPVFRGEVQVKSWSHSPRGRTLTVLLHADDCPNGAHPFDGFEGGRFAAVFVPMTDEEPAVAPKPHRRFRELPRSQQAGILSEDPSFAAWLTSGSGTPVVDELRRRLGVRSRAELDDGGPAAARWDRLLTEFEIAAGRVPEVR